MKLSKKKLIKAKKPLLCRFKGEQLRIGDFKILCVEPKIMCPEKVTKCPNNCSGRGKCMLNGKCWCDPLFSGESCENFEGCNQNNHLVCQDIINANGYIINSS